MADFYPVLVQIVLYISAQKWKNDIYLYPKSDDLRTRFEIKKELRCMSTHSQERGPFRSKSF